MIIINATGRLEAEQQARLSGYNVAGDAVPGVAQGTWEVPVRRWPRPIR